MLSGRSVNAVRNRYLRVSHQARTAAPALMGPAGA